VNEQLPGSAVVAESTAQAHLKVSVEWRRALSEPEGTGGETTS
jgi:hypothetical protein